VVSVAPGKHRRTDSDWPPDPGAAPWPQWDSPPPILHPDHPSGPIPRVREPGAPVRLAPGQARRSAPGGDPAGGLGGTVSPFASPSRLRQRRPVGNSGPVSVLPGASSPARGYPPDRGYPPAQAYDPGAGHHPAQGFPDTDSFWAAGRILDAADGRAAQITQAALDQAAAIRDAAEQEAAEIRRQAASQAVTIREAAEQEAAEMRVALLSMSDELGRVAASVTHNLSVPPGSAPGRAKVTARPAAKAAATTTRPGPVRQTGAKSAGRQAKVMRRMAAGFAVVSVIGAISGATELGLHGFPFFILRANGAGAGETGPKEPANPELPKKAGEVQCSVLSLACTLSTPSADHQSATHHQPTTSKK
jgi:hypothetical protein